MGSLFGGGSPSTNTTTITPPNPTGVPLQEPLMGVGQRQINQASPFAAYGSGGNLVPQVPFGQVALSGPNPTTFGDPFNAAHAQAFYGPNSGTMPATGAGGSSQSQGQGGGTSGSQGGGGANSGGNSSNSGNSQPPSPSGNNAQGGNGGGSYQAPPLGSPGVPAGVGQSQMPHMLSQLLQPGVLGQLFTAYGQHLQGQGGGGLGNQMMGQPQPGQIPDTNGAMLRPPMQGVPGAGSVNPGMGIA